MSRFSPISPASAPVPSLSPDLPWTAYSNQQYAGPYVLQTHTVLPYQSQVYAGGVLPNPQFYQSTDWTPYLQLHSAGMMPQISHPDQTVTYNYAGWQGPVNYQGYYQQASQSGLAGVVFQSPQFYPQAYVNSDSQPYMVGKDPKLATCPDRSVTVPSQGSVQRGIQTVPKHSQLTMETPGATCNQAYMWNTASHTTPVRPQTPTDTLQQTGHFAHPGTLNYPHNTSTFHPNISGKAISVAGPLTNNSQSHSEGLVPPVASSRTHLYSSSGMSQHDVQLKSQAGTVPSKQQYPYGDHTTGNNQDQGPASDTSVNPSSYVQKVQSIQKGNLVQNITQENNPILPTTIPTGQLDLQASFVGQIANQTLANLYKALRGRQQQKADHKDDKACVSAPKPTFVQKGKVTSSSLHQKSCIGHNQIADSSRQGMTRSEVFPAHPPSASPAAGSSVLSSASRTVVSPPVAAEPSVTLGQLGNQLPMKLPPTTSSGSMPQSEVPLVTTKMSSSANPESKLLLSKKKLSSVNTTQDTNQILLATTQTSQIDLNASFIGQITNHTLAKLYGALRGGQQQNDNACVSAPKSLQKDNVTSSLRHQKTSIGHNQNADSSRQRMTRSEVFPTHHTSASLARGSSISQASSRTVASPPVAAVPSLTLDQLGKLLPLKIPPTTSSRNMSQPDVPSLKTKVPSANPEVLPILSMKTISSMTDNEPLPKLHKKKMTSANYRELSQQQPKKTMSVTDHESSPQQPKKKVTPVSDTESLPQQPKKKMTSANDRTQEPQQTKRKVTSVNYRKQSPQQSKKMSSVNDHELFSQLPKKVTFVNDRKPSPQQPKKLTSVTDAEPLPLRPKKKISFLTDTKSLHQQPKKMTSLMVTEPLPQQHQKTMSSVTEPLPQQHQKTMSSVTEPLPQQHQKTMSSVTEPLPQQHQKTMSSVTEPLPQQHHKTMSSVTEPLPQQHHKTMSSVTDAKPILQQHKKMPSMTEPLPQKMSFETEKVNIDVSSLRMEPLKNQQKQSHVSLEEKAAEFRPLKRPSLSVRCQDPLKKPKLNYFDCMSRPAVEVMGRVEDRVQRPIKKLQTGQCVGTQTSKMRRIPSTRTPSDRNRSKGGTGDEGKCQVLKDKKSPTESVNCRFKEVRDYIKHLTGNRVADGVIDRAIVVLCKDEHVKKSPSEMKRLLFSLLDLEVNNT